MTRNTVFRASELQVIDKEASGVLQLPSECRLTVHLVSTAPFTLRAQAGPVAAVLGYGQEIRFTKDLEGFDELVIQASKSAVSGWCFVGGFQRGETLDPTPIKIVSPEEFEQSLTLEQMIRRELRRYHAAREDDEDAADDGLEFDDDGDDLDVAEPDDPAEEPGATADDAPTEREEAVVPAPTPDATAGASDQPPVSGPAAPPT